MIRHLLGKYCLSHPELVRNLSQSTYIDDIVYRANDEDSAHKLYVQSKDILQTGGFNLRKFITNSSQLQTRINKNEELLNTGVLKSERINSDDFEETYTKFTYDSWTQENRRYSE